MKLTKYHIDAFTNKLFGGNPACVIPLEEWLPNELLINITKENNLAETAFFVPEADRFHIRWFTPEIEMDLCGHATLATAHVIKKHLEYKEDRIRFTSASGDLEVAFEDHKYVLDFPSRMPVPTSLPSIIEDSLNIHPIEVFQARDYVLLYESEDDIMALEPDENKLKAIDLGHGGIVCTAIGRESDFVSRFFTPGASIFEDPVTGSAHCSLIPFWKEKIGKEQMLAMQLSDRKGVLHCSDCGDRVKIAGHAVSYSVGEIYLD
ncbi:PhzF family phenazine biosynthesis protein [Marinifilum caeruleilacunae]|uniref:PhzF family phenazine biosynthesis protein n=1 Tax=Marinifilum caeruleilacunae TaxID=2499076 RepID=A0ABX1WU56_9BACT|nr:PhzF family phenazine biosynthesis protein [Marinifilum caeruleilacunae]NOU59453.1 PhzF family phenazine biosynthesis protein [Marinifilum caeruleilacunae]